MTNTTVQGVPSAAETAEAELAKFSELVGQLIQLKLKSKAALVKRITPDLDRLNDNGFSQERLVEVMNQAGFDISLGTLKTILYRQRKSDEEAK